MRTATLALPENAAFVALAAFGLINRQIANRPPGRFSVAFSLECARKWRWGSTAYNDNKPK
ncbi:MAG: hypothetical protein EOQ45_30655 [Mesorhizobium sp.]|uniref:hypothetical protein n=1 Tax=Mesorhizobium sp. TaxID=1871066 RepID=UPI000FE51BCD|nr:hypothetical protein [Mesorhizobium sp.]RWF89610.1 MAG: hypothetical protein EOQ45_30655 [Mesorhizobium sp.]